MLVRLARPCETSWGAPNEMELPAAPNEMGSPARDWRQRNACSLPPATRQKVPGELIHHTIQEPVCLSQRGHLPSPSLLVPKLPFPHAGRRVLLLLQDERPSPRPESAPSLGLTPASPSHHPS
jgi:hypothetical protein